jgi:aspartokinase
MVTVSHLVNKQIRENSLFEEAIRSKIVSYAALANKIKPEIEAELGAKVKPSAIIMALRRMEEELEAETKQRKPILYSSELILKTNICDICLVRSASFLKSLSKIYELIDFEKGDIINIIHGSNEISIITNEKYKERLVELLVGEKILNIEESLVSLSLTYPKEFFYTPGIIFEVTRKLAWEKVNILEIVSTMSELTFILAEKDGIKGYNALREFIKR